MQVSTDIVDCITHEYFKPLYCHIRDNENHEVECLSEVEFAFLYEVQSFDDILLYIRIVKHNAQLRYMCDLKNIHDGTIDLEGIIDFLLELIESLDLDNRFKPQKYEDPKGNTIIAVGCEVKLQDVEEDNIATFDEVMIDLEDFIATVGVDWVRRYLRSS